VKEALDRAAARIGERFRDQPSVEAAIQSAIGEAYAVLGEYRLAAKHLERTVELRRSDLETNHQETRRCTEILANAYTWIGRTSDAVALYEQLLENAKTRLALNDPEVVGWMGRLAMAYQRAGELKKAMELLELAIKLDETLRGPSAAGASNYAHILAMVYQEAGMYEESAARFDKIRELGKVLNQACDEDAYFMLHVAQAYQRAGRLDEADPILRRQIEFARKRTDSLGQINVAHKIEYLCLNLLLQDRYVEAEKLAREALALYDKNHTTDREWRRPYVMSLLGGALVGRKKYADAEPLLLQGYEGMKQAETTIVGQWRYRLTEAGERVIRYYEETNQPEKAREWRKKIREDKSEK
jgi:eukaryotic-like serine/threonine-protein kinase